MNECARAYTHIHPNMHTHKHTHTRTHTHTNLDYDGRQSALQLPDDDAECMEVSVKGFGVRVHDVIRYALKLLHRLHMCQRMCVCVYVYEGVSMTSYNTP